MISRTLFNEENMRPIMKYDNYIDLVDIEIPNKPGYYKINKSTGPALYI